MSPDERSRAFIPGRGCAGARGGDKVAGPAASFLVATAETKKEGDQKAQLGKDTHYVTPLNLYFTQGTRTYLDHTSAPTLTLKGWGEVVPMFHVSNLASCCWWEGDFLLPSPPPKGRLRFPNRISGGSILGTWLGAPLPQEPSNMEEGGRMGRGVIEGGSLAHPQ